MQSQIGALQEEVAYLRYQHGLLPYRDKPYHRLQGYQHPRGQPHFTQYRGGRPPPTKPRTKPTPDSGNRSPSCSTSHASATRNRASSCSASSEPTSDTRGRFTSCSPTGVRTTNTQYDSLANTATTHHIGK
ncbi:hypothetical protein SERLADRAFT_404178, partial [Serpula lacrymans var. lacrymans S7.9]